ncbi:MAG: hypothetical protein NC098_03125 [Lachnoclostridium sp.]|nr:hypothetical protein [Lachnoclostridium sp.]
MSASSEVVTAQSIVSPELICRLTLPAHRKLMEISSSSPATMNLLDSASFSGISVGYEYDHQQQALMQQLGDGAQRFSIDAQSFSHLSEATTVWGTAGFSTGSMRNVRWSNCIDFERVAPYVLGDGTGGDLSTRTYTFSGGYNRRFDRWTLGVDAAYRAEIAYRNRDPRVKTVVSDLDIDLGGSYRFTDRYVAGVNTGINVYNQNSDLEFYNPVNDINTYPLTGLGTYYKRFTGNTTKSTGHQSLGLSVGVQLIPVNGEGFAADILFDHYRMNERLRNYNNLTLAYTDNNLMTANLLYLSSLSSLLKIAPSLSLTSRSRKGTENLFGTSSAMSYDVIGTRSNYRHSSLIGRLQIPVELHLAAGYFTVTPAATFDHTSEKIIDIDRRLSVSHLTPELNLDFSAITSRRLLWRAGLSAAYSCTSAPEKDNNILRQAPSIEPDQLSSCVVENYDMLIADHLGLGANINVTKQINRIIYGIELSYNYFHYSGHGSRNSLAVTLSATF